MQLLLSGAFLLAGVVAPLPAEAGVTIRAGTASGARSQVHFYIEDQLGRKSGQNANGQYLSEIPGTVGKYISPSVGDASTVDPNLDYAELAANLPQGQYKLVVIPLATTSYFLHFYIENDNLNYLEVDNKDYAIAGATISYDFAYEPAASTPTAFVKLVSFPSLRQSLQAASTLGQIGDSAFISRLNKMLLKAEEQASKDQKKQAADRLDQFIRRLESAFKKEPDPNADDDPADKKSADAVKRFILPQARDTLQADARTLITSLGETPKK